jgi:hypothetical protein
MPELQDLRIAGLQEEKIKDGSYCVALRAFPFCNSAILQFISSVVR